ncbi:MAG: apolipoprotein N-acyltransferase [Planctomycetota bacterium]
MSEPAIQAVSQRYGIQAVSAHLAMCAATAVLMTLAFPLPGWSFMAFFALVPVGVLAMRTRRLWTLAWTSYAVFFVWWTLRVIWLREVQTFAPLGIALVCAGYFSAALIALASVQRRFKGAMTLTLPIFWCAQEVARSVWPVGGFAWFTLGTSQAAWRVGEHPGYLVQTADLFGWVTVSFLVAMTSGLIVDLIARPLIKRYSDGRVRPRRTVLTAAVLWAGCMGASFYYGYLSIQETPDPLSADAQTASVGIVQTNVPQSNKISGTREQKEIDFDRLLELSEQAAADHPKPDLILWPETMVQEPVNDEALGLSPQFNPPFDELIPEVRSRIQGHSDRFGIPLMVGNPARYVYDNNRSMNSALFVTPGSDTFRRYSKMHLVPMGEYIPGPAWVRDLFLKHLSPYDYDYTVQPGEGIVIFEVDEVELLGQPDAGSEAASHPLRLATPICYEDAVAIQCRKMVYGNDGIKRADMLLNLTNDGWYPGSHQGYQHLQIAAMRCIENRVPMARSVNTGVSGMIDSAGRVGPLVTVGGEHQEVDGYVNATVAIDPRTTLYGRVREAAWVGLCGVALLLLLGVLVPGKTKRGEST